jgi:glycosyltransferase involved in cell wall biosynthesis
MQQYARVGESSEIVLIVDHNLGGGANQYRERWIKEKQQDGKHVLLLCYDFASLSYHIQSSGKNGNELFALESVEAFSDMAKNIRFEEIFLNNVYSFDDPLAIVTLLPALKYSTGAKLGVAINDYYSICPSYTLLDYTNNRFCGVPEILRCQECLPSNHGYFSLVVDCKDIGLWRRTWGACLRSADKIICFSNSSIPILQRAYPDLDVAKCEVRPHAVDYLTQHRLVLHHQGPLNIGIVGTINTTHKGAHIVRQMAHLIKEQHLPARITVIGELEGETPQSVVEVTGRYEREHLPEVIEKSGANIFFLPSIIPETFSYVTEELIQLNLPLAVFDLGAPAERVKRYANGIIIHEVDAQHALQQLLAFHERQRQLNARGNI